MSIHIHSYGGSESDKAILLFVPKPQTSNNKKLSTPPCSPSGCCPLTFLFFSLLPCRPRSMLRLTRSRGWMSRPPSATAFLVDRPLLLLPGDMICPWRLWTLKSDSAAINVASSSSSLPAPPSRLSCVRMPAGRGAEEEKALGRGGVGGGMSLVISVA